MPFNVSEILSGSAPLLNDIGLTSFTYVAQLPYLKIAVEDLRQELMDNGIPVSHFTSAAITIASGETNIGGDDGPALPADLIDIISVWERTSGSNSDYLLMRKLSFLPKVNSVTSYLGIYSWDNQVISFLGATGPIEIKIDYIGDPLGSVVDENSQLRTYNTKNFLIYRNAALCAEFAGEDKERATALNANAQRSLDTLLSISIKGQQNIMTRRRPFRR